MDSIAILASSVHWGGFQWTGNYTTIDLIAASTNALNGALLARRPDHYKGFTVVGILLMALLGGLGGGITRDLLVAEVPSALTNPAYITLALLFGVIGYGVAYTGGQLFREGLFQFMTSFSLPLYAIVGAQKGVTVGLPVLGVLALGVIGPTAGRWYVDVSSGGGTAGFFPSTGPHHGRVDCRLRRLPVTAQHSSTTGLRPCCRRATERLLYRIAG